MRLRLEVVPETKIGLRQQELNLSAQGRTGRYDLQIIQDLDGRIELPLFILDPGFLEAFGGRGLLPAGSGTGESPWHEHGKEENDVWVPDFQQELL